MLPTLVDYALGSTRTVLPDSVEGESLVPLINGHALQRGNRIFAEYTADGAIAPCLMVKEGDLKLIWSSKDGAQLYDLAEDPLELTNRCDDPSYRERLAALMELILENWDPDAMSKEIVASQRRRLFLLAATKATLPVWDFEPRTDVSAQYVRSGMSPAVVKGKARFPPVSPVPPDHPRNDPPDAGPNRTAEEPHIAPR
jgi:choline-sulfatase